MTGHHLLAMFALGNLSVGNRVLAIHFHHAGVKPIWQWRVIYYFACKKFQAITFPSDFIRKEAEVIYPPVKFLSHTIRNPLSIPPVTTDNDRRKSRKYFGIPDDAMVVGNAGWLIPRKRFDIFLHVAQKVIASVPKVIFIIAGDGEDKSRLHDLAANLGIIDNIMWLGWQRDVTPFFQSLDIMLFNSDFDAMGMSPLEAMSFGVPLVASVVHGGLKEIIDNDKYGFLLDTHNVVKLSNYVIYLLQNPTIAREIALTGRQRVADVSNSHEHAKNIECLLLGRNQSTSNLTRNDA